MVASGSCHWISKDPSRWGGGLNFYVYADNNPDNGVDPTGRDVCYHSCTGGYHHEWAEFDHDPSRSYGFWPEGISHPFGGRGALVSPDIPNGICKPGPPVCRASSAENDAKVERELKDTFKDQVYFFGISDCRALPDFVERRLDELENTPDPVRDFWDLLFNLL
jgi:hypothetical protein